MGVQGGSLLVPSDDMRCPEASKRCVSSKEGDVSAKRVSRLASFRGGAKHHDVRSLAASLVFQLCGSVGRHSKCGVLKES